MATMKTLNGYGFNATELNGKVASDYLQKTDTASDSAKLGGKAPEYYIQPRNLLDNSDFRNPVNQRGYEGVDNKYMYPIDRWQFDKSTDSAASAGYDSTNKYIWIINTNAAYADIHQKIEPKALKNGVYTLAVKQRLFGGMTLVVYSDNTKVAEKLVSPNSSDPIALVNFTLNAVPSTALTVYLYTATGNTVAFEWAALYEGSYTADTLPPYVSKGYAAELAECQWYYRRGGQAVTIGKLYSGGGIFSLYFPKMRTYPTINILEISSQGWGNVDASNYTQGWGDDYGCEHYRNFTSSITDDVGKTVIVKYECSADL